MDNFGASIVGVVKRVDGVDTTCGYGVAVTDSTFVTCAHVVADALGISREQKLAPTDSVSISAPFGTTNDPLPTALVTKWVPMDGTRGDLALLRCNPPACLVPAHLDAATAPNGQAFSAFGLVGLLGERWTQGVCGPYLPNGRIQIERSADSGYWLRKGFSGSPLLTASGAVIGIVTALDGPAVDKVGVAISAEMFCTTLGLPTPPQPSGSELDKYLADLLARSSEELAQAGRPLIPRIQSTSGDTLSVSSALMNTEGRRILLVGDGGSGKSHCVLRLIGELIRLGVVPIWLDLRGWSEDDTRDLRKAAEVGTVNDQLDVVLRRTAMADDLSVARLDALVGENRPVAIVVDSLNEVGEPRLDTAVHPRTQILKTIKEYIRTVRPNQTSSVVASREVHGSHEGWAVANVVPLTRNEVRSALEEVDLGDEFDRLTETRKELLGSPFFLNIALTAGGLGFKTLTEAVQQQVAASVPESLIPCVQCIALCMYEQFRTTAVSVDSLQSCGRCTLDEAVLDNAGVLRRDRDMLMFRHQLVHDYFAALEVANEWREEELTEGSILDRWLELFEGTSFGGVSFECLLMAADRIESEHGDSVAFLTWLYDWNYQIVIQALTSGSAGDSLGTLAFVVTALVAEKRFDSLDETRRDAEQTVASVSATRESLRPLMEAPDLNGLLAEVRKQNLNGWAARWQTVFTGANATAQAILDENALIGWSAANVLKRSVLSSKNENLICNYFEALSVPTPSDDAYHKTRRWRIAHALGAGNSVRSGDLLVDALLNDGYPWVRSGALRSLLERLANRPHGLGRQVRSRVEGAFNSFDSRLRARAARSLTAGGEASGWIDTQAKLREVLLASADPAEVVLFKKRWSDFESRPDVV